MKLTSTYKLGNYIKTSNELIDETKQHVKDLEKNIHQAYKIKANIIATSCEMNLLKIVNKYFSKAYPYMALKSRHSGTLEKVYFSILDEMAESDPVAESLNEFIKRDEVRLYHYKDAVGLVGSLVYRVMNQEQYESILNESHSLYQEAVKTKKEKRKEIKRKLRIEEDNSRYAFSISKLPEPLDALLPAS